MRADRLVAVLLMLQARGTVTASQVAAELEISERTARRDLEALGVAGLPIYSKQGRGGGWSLLGGARTDLSGLNAAEARALFLVLGPSSAATPEVRAALRKLVRALPESFRAGAEAAASAVVVDSVGWDRPAAPPPRHLDALQRAVIDGMQVVLGYQGPDKPAGSRLVHPLGLAAKGTVWYLLADTALGMRTFRVSRVTSVEQTGEPVVRPANFDLGTAWREVTAVVDERRRAVRATLLVQEHVLGNLRVLVGSRLAVGPAGAGGAVHAEVSGSSALRIAVELAGFGSAVEVVHPPDVRDHLARLGRELTERYRPT
jgi:predicted DNA-binding transcriptional regulator YafY